MIGTGELVFLQGSLFRVSQQTVPLKFAYFPTSITEEVFLAMCLEAGPTSMGERTMFQAQLNKAFQKDGQCIE